MANFQSLPVELQQAIINSMEVPDMLRFAATSRDTFNLTYDTIYHAFSQKFPHSDLDIYVHKDKERVFISAVKALGYGSHTRIRPSKLEVSAEEAEANEMGPKDHIFFRSHYLDTAIADINEFRNCRGDTIQVISTIGPPMDVIFGFHSSCVMNVIGCDFAYCLYPRATIEYGVSIRRRGTDNNSFRARMKYTERGWMCLNRDTSMPSLDLRSVNRPIGDRFCWTIPIDYKVSTDNFAEYQTRRSKDKLTGHSWKLNFAWLSLPEFQQSYCVTDKVMYRLQPHMSTCSDAFTFIANHETGEEEVFEVHGVLSEVKLPPVPKNSRVRVNDLIQTVKIISIDGDEEFRKACVAIARLEDLLQQSTATTTKVPYGIKQGTASELVFVNRLLTPTHSACTEDVVTIPESYDPNHCLKDVLGENKFLYTRDSQVTFNKLQRDGHDNSRRISGIKPGIFRPGQIVSIGVSFRLVKSRQNDQMMFLSHLDSLTLLSWGVRKILDEQPRINQQRSLRKLPTKRRAFVITEEPKEKEKALETEELNDTMSVD
ncbi:hypothetical protein ARMGADRAFT_1079313 [Armillaria gallica]|uniref:F-box domain-containing protein n=1 Tax=Armillaria gallica TaxID=47427 RepID=A0A2H3DI81_ARMGA|nr:hypothetical protein ARMGADRAFT_1079313 [Armillaria gallica]